MAKAKSKRRSRKNNFTIPVAVVAGFFPLANQMRMGWGNDGVIGAGKEAVYALTGFHLDSGTHNWNWMWYGTWSILAGAAVHYVAKRMGINRALSSAGIPLLRV